MDQHDAATAAAQAAEALGPEADFVAGLDPVLFGRALAETGLGLARHPARATLAGTRYTTRLATAGAVAWARAFGARTEPPLPPPSRDRRFADPAWADNPWFFGILQGYLASARLAQELVGAAEVDDRWRDKAELAVQLLVDALAPTNFLPTNPAALKRAFDTGGRSVVRGLGHFLDDLATNQGRPRQVDTSPFELGVNLAATKGKVVFRNRLMELIQYAPTTRTTYETPLLASPPWINKYYVMDLAPGRSFVQWADDHGHTVFAISYRNPDASMRDVTLDAYLLEGPRIALDVLGEITGAPQVNIVGLCLGGTLTTMLLAYLETDHITPWTSSYKTTQLLKSNARFVLTSSGHIAGIVNPPSPKTRYWTGDPTPPDPAAWLAAEREQQGSWWQDWAEWAKRQGGQRKKPPRMGSDAHPALADAPGAYVRER